MGTKTFKQITPEDLIPEVRKLALENPDQKATCNYRECIVGKAYQALGTEVLSNYDSLTIKSIMDRFWPNADELQVSWLQTTQGNQDLGHDWDTAVKLADNIHPISL